MPLNSIAGDFSDSYVKEKIVSRLIASIAFLTAAAVLTGCAVAPGYDPGYGYGYGQPYYPAYGYYGYGYPYAPVYGSVGIYGGWGGCCYYHGGHGYWHGRGGGGHGGWHGGGYGGYGGSRGGSSWSSGGGSHGGGHGH